MLSGKVCMLVLKKGKMAQTEGTELTDRMHIRC